MERIESVHQMQSLAISLREKGGPIALIPTQGALHAGHRALIDAARKNAGTVVLSCFVNPLQFGSNEDHTTYPNRLEEDVKCCEEAGVDVMFIPKAEEMYPAGFSSAVVEEEMSSGMCGVSRPTHFRGVTTAITKLLNIIRPHVIVYGQQTIQQAIVVRKMCEDLCFGVQVLVEPTVREEDGVPCSSRNKSLTSGQREDAQFVYKALTEGKRLVDSGITNIDRVVAEATHIVSERRRVRVIYVQIVDRESMKPMREIESGRSLLVLAVWIDEIRLIDNILL